MAEPNDHPSPEQLRAFGLGKLPPEAQTGINQHLAVCPACCRVVDEITPDSFLQLVQRSVRSAGGPQPTATGTATSASDQSLGLPDLPAALVDHPRYRVLAKLGQGGMGVVYRAEHRLMERAVALKVIRKEWLVQPAAAERFRAEVKAVARLAHPNIVAAYDAEQVGDCHVLVMEYVEGINLARLVERDGPLSVAAAADVIRQVAVGLQQAWEAGLVHRDIKPHNLMRTPQGVVKILDFGLARLGQRQSEGTGEPTVLGTPDYLAPEQTADADRADVRSDLYSLGCTFYFLLAGQAPFAGGSAFNKALAHRERQPRPLTEFRPDVPAGLGQVFGRLLAKDPERRYQTPQEVVEALAPFQTGNPRTATEPALPHATQPGSQRRVLGAALVLVLAGSVGGVLWLAGPNQVRTSAPEQGSTPAPEPVGPASDPGPSAQQGKEELPIGEVRVLRGHTDTVNSVAVSPDGRLVLSGGSDRKNLRLWDFDTGAELAVWEGDPAAILSVAFSPQGDRAFTGGHDCTGRLWEVKPGRELRKFKVPLCTWVMGIAVTADGRWVVTAHGQNSVEARLWDVETGQMIREFKGHTRALFCAAAGPPGQVLTGAMDGSVRLWDSATGKEQRRFDHPRWVYAVACHAESKLILTGSDQAARLWDLDTEKEVGRLEGHTKVVRGVALSADGRRALTGSEDQSVRLWDVGTGKELRVFRGHAGIVTCVRFTPDGRFAVSSSRDKTIRVWRLPP